MSTIKKIPVRVDETQYDILSQIKNDIGTPVAESVRRAIFEYIKENYPRYLGTANGNGKDGNFYSFNLD